MPTFLTRLRSLGTFVHTYGARKGLSTPIAEHMASVPPETPPPGASSMPSSPEVALDSKIHPDISTLFASVENEATDSHSEENRGVLQALRPNRRRPKADTPQTDLIEKDGSGMIDKGKENAEDLFGGKASMETDVPPSSFTFGSQAGWSTFGREGRRVIPGLKELGRRRRRQSPSDGTNAGTSVQSKRSKESSSLSPGKATTSQVSTSNTNSQRTASTFGRPPVPSRPNTAVSIASQGVTVSTGKSPSRKSSGDVSGAANIQPSTGNPALTWSPEREPSPEPSLSSQSAQATSPELQHSKSAFNSPSPGTFGYPTPLQPSQPSSPQIPFPIFQSTPKTPATLPFLSTPDSIPERSTRYRFTKGGGFPPLSSTFGKAFRSQTGRSKESKMNIRSMNELGEHSRSRSRPGADVARRQRRRQSAEWNARSASAGVTASPSEGYGWPADVSREMLRLSLGGEAAVQTQESTVATTNPLADLSATRERILSAPISLRNKVPRGSHELLQASSRPVNDSGHVGARQGRSSHSFSFPIPSPSTAPAHWPAPGPADPDSLELGSSSDLGNQARSEGSERRPLSRVDKIGNPVLAVDAQASGEGRMVRHMRTASDNQVKWESKQLQDFLATAGGDGEVGANALRPSTPMKPSESTSTYYSAGSSSLLHAPSLSVVSPTPEGSPGRSRQESGNGSGEGLGIPVTPTPPKSDKSKGKRKADETEDGSPPGSKSSRKTTFAEDGRGPHRVSNSSRAPSSFQSQKSRKRVRLSSPMATPAHSRRGSISNSNAPNFSSLSSRGSSRSAIATANSQSHFPPSMPSPPPNASPPRPTSRASRAKSMSATSSAGRVPNRRSLSQSSIPLSAIVSPRAPSIDRLSTFHMRDPRKPPPKRRVGWRLRLRTLDDEGSPFHAYAFWFGFFLPVLWWVASFWRIPKTRMVGTDPEKAIPVDDPHVEREARSWRIRCRIASVVFFFTYAPVIVLLAVFVPRS